MANNKQILYENPSWPDLAKYKSVIQSLNEYPNLVFPNEIENLKTELLEVSNGKKFIFRVEIVLKHLKTLVIKL